MRIYRTSQPANSCSSPHTAAGRKSHHHFATGHLQGVTVTHIDSTVSWEQIDTATSYRTLNRILLLNRERPEAVVGSHDDDFCLAADCGDGEDSSWRKSIIYSVYCTSPDIITHAKFINMFMVWIFDEYETREYSAKRWTWAHFFARSLMPCSHESGVE